MSRGIPESDWKLFRVLREVALDRFCARALEDLELTLQDASRSHHERYLDIYRHLQDRDRELAFCFDGARRSRMLLQLSAIHSRNLLEPEEVARFTAETQEFLEPARK